MTTVKRTNAGGRPNGEADSAGNKSARPSDMELMLYFDGELDSARMAEVGAYIDRDRAARQKLSGLRMASGVVRERALSPDIGFDIAASVMGAIESGAGEKKADSAGAKPIDLQSARQAALAARSSKPANDNSRSIFVLAAIAMAAAAAMMVWGRMGAETPKSAENSAPVMTQQAAPAESAPKAAPAEVAPAEPATADSDMEHGVEVAAVDFGAHMGTIFYVPTGAAASNATTTVVWVDDEVAGGK